MSKKLWQPSLIVKRSSNLSAFENYISKKFKIKFNRNYKNLLNWSIKIHLSFVVDFGILAK